VFLAFTFFKKKFNYKSFISLIPFLLILLPHLIWLTENDYITITYGLLRTGAGDQIFQDHLILPIIFLGKQIGILIPFFIMCFLLISEFKSKLNFKDEKLLFLLAINIVPILLMFLTSMIMGVKIRTMWMTSFYLFLGILLIYIFQSQINFNIKSFLSVFIILFILSPFVYVYISITETDKRTDYPGKEIAKIVKNEWITKYPNKKINVVGDDEWHGGNLSYHLKSRPKAFIFHSKEEIYFPRNNTDLKIFQCDISGVCPFLCETKRCKKFEINNFKFQTFMHPIEIK